MERLRALRVWFSDRSRVEQVVIVGVLGLIAGVVIGGITVMAVPRVNYSPIAVGVVFGAVAAFVTWLQTQPDVPETPQWGVAAPLPTEPGSVITRSFRGSLEQASAEATAYLSRIRSEGWVESNRTYTPGQWGCGAFLIALLLAVILIGILIFIYLLVVKPDGTLVVTYTKSPPVAPPAVASGQSAANELASWAKLRDTGVITEEEFQAKKRSLLGK